MFVSKKMIEFDVYTCIEKRCGNKDRVKSYSEKDIPKCKNCGRTMSWIGYGVER